MNEQTWALLGVVVGALLGGAAQILAGVLQESRRHKQWLRDQRVRVYQQFMVEWRSRFVALWDYVYIEHSVYNGPGPEDDYLMPLHDHAADLELFGSPEAIAASTAAIDALFTYWQSSGDKRKGTEAAAEAAYRKYRDRVRAELGVA